MALPTDTIPLRDAVVHALTQVTTAPAAIPEAFLFTPARPNPRAQRSGTLTGGPSAWVVVRDHSADPNKLLLEGSSIRGLVVVVEIVCDYYGGSEDFTPEHEAALERIEADRTRVIDALVAPGALLTDPDGNDTGLDGDGCLRFDGYRSAGPALAPQKTRVLRVTHFFRATLEVAKA